MDEFLTEDIVPGTSLMDAVLRLRRDAAASASAGDTDADDEAMSQCVFSASQRALICRALQSKAARCSAASDDGAQSSRKRKDAPTLSSVASPPTESSVTSGSHEGSDAINAAQASASKRRAVAASGAAASVSPPFLSVRTASADSDVGTDSATTVQREAPRRAAAAAAASSASASAGASTLYTDAEDAHIMRLALQAYENGATSGYTKPKLWSGALLQQHYECTGVRRTGTALGLRLSRLLRKKANREIYLQITQAKEKAMQALKK